MNLSVRSLSPREVGALAALAATALACLVMMGVVPALRTTHAQAAARLGEASALLAWSERQTSTSTRTLTLDAPLAPEQRGQKLVDLAVRAGLQVSRLQNSERGIVIQLDGVSSQNFYAWLAEAEQQAGLSPTEVFVESEADGRISASLSFGSQ